MAKVIGFTGTQQGMTALQKHNLRLELTGYYANGAREFHHGDCVGADSEAHDIAIDIGYDIVIHPPKNETKRAFRVLPTKRIRVLPAKEYLDRNHDIVDACDVLIAAPATRREVLRSGTWATVRYARKVRGKWIVTLHPAAANPSA